MSGCWGDPVSPILDVQGCNYNHGSYDDYHKKYPSHPMLSSENFTCGYSTRGEYENNEQLGICSSYDKFPIRPDCTAEHLWKLVAEREFVAGTFPWTGFDYRGEAGPTGWPCVSSNFGILDTCGFPKDIFFYYKSCWSKQTVLHVFPHWNWQGRSPEIPGREHSADLGLRNTIDNYDISLAANPKLTSLFHIGDGLAGSRERDPKKIDCLVCHDTTSALSLIHI